MSTDRIVELGRLLADEFDDSDRHYETRRWMAFYLAQLIAADDEGNGTIEQHEEIVDLILRIWSYRHVYPNSGPMAEYGHVLAALERLGDDSPWRFSRLPLSASSSQNPEAAEYIALAEELERLSRDAVITLLGIAARKAADAEDVWLAAAAEVAESLEADLTRTLESLLRSVDMRRRMQAVLIVGDDSADADPLDVLDSPADPADATEEAALVDVDSESHDEGGGIATLDPFALALHKMSALLTRVADALPRQVGNEDPYEDPRELLR